MKDVKDGINMIAVKKGNRKSILNLVYRSGQISRKSMAQALGLTPAAITLITTDLLDEGLIMEAAPGKASGKKGRKEVMLQMNAGRYVALGVYVGTQRFLILAMDLENNILFEQAVNTEGMRRNSEQILAKIADTIEENLEEHQVLKNRKLLGVGISVNGIVDSRAGVSVNSYRIWENNVPVAQKLEDRLHVPVLLTNNICAMAHGENFLSGSSRRDNMFFIKYGPGVGATHFSQEGSSSVFDYKAIQLGHMIMDPEGAPCVCGNQGCLETIVSYASIENSVEGLINESSSPILSSLTNNETRKLRMSHILTAYDERDHLAEQAIDRTVHYLSLAIKNAMRLFDPLLVVLYGEPFENARFSAALREQLSVYTETDKVVFSRFNLQLETFGPASTMISYFFENGGSFQGVEQEEEPEAPSI